MILISTIHKPVNGISLNLQHSCTLASLISVSTKPELDYIYPIKHFNCKCGFFCWALDHPKAAQDGATAASCGYV